MSAVTLGVADDVHEPAAQRAAAMASRTGQLLHGPVVLTLLRLATPNILVMLAQAATGLIETYFVARLGTDALAGMALVFPLVMLMQMISAGAMGGGISSAIARAIGGGRRDDGHVWQDPFADSLGRRGVPSVGALRPDDERYERR